MASSLTEVPEDDAVHGGLLEEVTRLREAVAALRADARRLDGKVAIVTGAGRGIGQAIAERFCQEGSTVFVADVNRSTGVAIASRLREESGDATFVEVDVSDPQSVSRMYDAVVGERGRVDIVVANAGILADARAVTMTDEQWDRVLAVNLNGVFYCARGAARLMIEQGYGRIILASSVVGMKGNFGQVNYAAAKAGVTGIARSLAREVA